MSFLTTDILFALHVSVEDAHFVAIDKLIETITQESLTFFLQSSIFSSLVPDEFTVGVKHITYATAFVYWMEDLNPAVPCTLYCWVVSCSKVTWLVIWATTDGRAVNVTIKFNLNNSEPSTQLNSTLFCFFKIRFTKALLFIIISLWVRLLDWEQNLNRALN